MLWKNNIVLRKLIFLIMILSSMFVISSNAKLIHNNDIYYGVLDLEPDRTLDPARFYDLYSAKVAKQIYNRLVKFDDKLDIVGDLAEKFTV